MFRYASRILLPACLLIAAASPVILLYLTDRYMNVFHQGALIRCLFGFSLGVAGWYVAPWLKRISLGGRIQETAIELAAVALVVLFVSTCSSGPMTVLAPFVFFIAAMTFARERGGVSSLLLTRPFEHLGKLSYSIYMIHMFLLYRFVNGLSFVEKMTGFDAVSSRGINNSVGGGAWFSDAMTILFLTIVIGLATLTYRFVERPGQQYSRNRVNGTSSSKPQFAG
jgi:peptidoglycan/LPS O-acetylase OafA/YrhL